MRKVIAVAILLGPLLGLEGEGRYSVCVLCTPDVTAPEVVDDRSIVAQGIQPTPSGVFWRADLPIEVGASGSLHRYEVRMGGQPMPDAGGRSGWKFWVPGSGEEPRIAYASCNGFSDGATKGHLEEPYAMWRRLTEDHDRAPFSLLIMGGDQLYADEIWHNKDQAPSLFEWSQRGRKARETAAVMPTLAHELDRFYEHLYIRNWNQDDVSLMLASIPSVMMWDDHDIFDGWGSYPGALQGCPVYQAVFAVARRYFEMFQLRSTLNTTLLDRGGQHYSFGLRFRDYAILGLDNRSNRTESVVMGDQNWVDVKGWLQQSSRSVRTLLVLSAVPVVYRGFQDVEFAFDVTPWQEELTDDIRDQWRSTYHTTERLKLINNVLAVEPPGTQRVKRVFLSGDVHVGCVGIIRDRRQAGVERVIHQVVSSGIVHPAPTWSEWLGIKATSLEDPESLDGDALTAEFLTLQGAGRFLRTRNYCSLKEGTDSKLWVTWTCENGRSPVHPIESSA